MQCFFTIFYTQFSHAINFKLIVSQNFNVIFLKRLKIFVFLLVASKFRSQLSGNKINLSGLINTFSFCNLNSLS